MINKYLVFVICLLSQFSMATAKDKAQVKIAAASDMKFALEELKKNFEAIHPNTEIGLTMGSSGKLFEQINNGAPFDLFFSADLIFPKKLQAARKGTTVSSYGFGKIVLWSLKKTPVELNELKTISFKTLAIANPLHAPYGARAIEALKKLGIYESIKDKLVLGENISQTAQFVETGAADYGIIAFSIVMSPTLKEKGSYSLISEKLYTPLEQGFILLKKENVTAANFVEFLKSARAKLILKKYGFAGTELWI